MKLKGVGWTVIRTDGLERFSQTSEKSQIPGLDGHQRGLAVHRKFPSYGAEQPMEDEARVSIRGKRRQPHHEDPQASTRMALRTLSRPAGTFSQSFTPFRGIIHKGL